MPYTNVRTKNYMKATHRKHRKAELPTDQTGRPLRISEYFGQNTFDVFKSNRIPDSAKKELRSVLKNGKSVSKSSADTVAQVVMEWAVSRGATHFCHWFQPLTGSTAEKHDAFLTFDKDDQPIEKLSASQLVQGEPDASSFPHGGSRSTFEARGYTSWDLTSPLFILESVNGKTLYIPTAFVSYYGDALDMKTPLLRSISRLDAVMTEFLNLTGSPEVKSVSVTCGAEQEYFLVDKAFYYSRPDLVMTGKALIGSTTTRNQQLEDHYFGEITDRVMSFMQELEIELYKLGIPAKTRHNEVAPGQFELAQIFRDGNVANDNNQMVMAMIRKVAQKHDLVALLHEKPFPGINGSGKHLNWSMADDKGRNLLEPGKSPHENSRFLAVVAMIIEAVNRRADMLRMSISSHGNDHRLGANEAPPSIISVFLGDTLDKIYRSILDSNQFSPSNEGMLDMGTNQLANLSKDNTDRNRTSPFAFTGNKFEYRAVGSSAAIGFPMSVLNAAIAEVVSEFNAKIKDKVKSSADIESALSEITSTCIKNSYQVVFNGDGYSAEWVDEAARRGLPNLRTTADCLAAFNDKKRTSFLVEQKIYRETELETRYNILLERYVKHREIEVDTLRNLVDQFVLPSTVNYKLKLAEAIDEISDHGHDCRFEKERLKRLSELSDSIYSDTHNLTMYLKDFDKLPELEKAQRIATELLPLTEKIAEQCNQVEDILPDGCWGLPKFVDLLFVR